MHKASEKSCSCCSWRAQDGNATPNNSDRNNNCNLVSFDFFCGFFFVFLILQLAICIPTEHEKQKYNNKKIKTLIFTFEFMTNDIRLFAYPFPNPSPTHSQCCGWITLNGTRLDSVAVCAPICELAELRVRADKLNLLADKWRLSHISLSLSLFIGASTTHARTHWGTVVNTVSTINKQVILTPLYFVYSVRHTH